MINADPQRTPSFTLFANPDFFFQTTRHGLRPRSASTTTSPGTTATRSPRSPAPGSASSARACAPAVAVTSPFTDHTDVRPTVLDLVGLHDSYASDGRIVTEALRAGRDPGGPSAEPACSPRRSAPR